MRYLAVIGARVMSMGAAVDLLCHGRPIPSRAVVLTFDDGYENFFEYALPILEHHHFPATVYAIAGLVGRTAEWLASDGHATSALMDAARLRELAQHGVEVGSHAYTHVPLAGLPVAQLRHEILDSRRALEDLLGRPVVHFCYPYGSHDPATLDVAAEAGYAGAVTCQRGAATRAFDVLALPRKAISFGDNVIGFAWKLHMKDRPKGTALKRT
ncbi:MAG TPA: polysaccharide deacetylase family protein [Nevskiaceae bacterium]|nr:polysaccharide deacetylase family protein [Nevskiaceae bacterium]